MKPKYYLGITSYATEGKDTVCDILVDKFAKQNVKAKRKALADELKIQIRPELIEKYGIDVFNCTPEEKKIIRPDLVAYGKAKREGSFGTHWTNTLDNIVAGWAEDVVIIPDLRYAYYVGTDELDWIKGKEKGLLLAVTRYEVINGEMVYIQPPNEDERVNGPIMKAASDFHLEWETLPREELILRYSPFLDNLVSFVQQKLE
jgi:hypothetical protein